MERSVVLVKQFIFHLTCVIHKRSILAWGRFFGPHFAVVSHGTYISGYTISRIPSFSTRCAVIACITVVGHGYQSCGFTVLSRITLDAIRIVLFSSIRVVRAFRAGDRNGSAFRTVASVWTVSSVWFIDGRRFLRATYAPETFRTFLSWHNCLRRTPISSATR